MIGKVNFEKSYDLINWSFLYYMMYWLGFRYKWIGWIKVRLESSSISILVNKSLSQKFKFKKELRQGDPITFFFFLTVAKGLLRMVREATSKNMLKGLKMHNKDVEVSVLQFIVDTLFHEAEYHNIRLIKRILRCFELASRLKIKFYKSKIGVVGVSREEMQRFSTTLNCIFIWVRRSKKMQHLGGSDR